MKKIIYLVAAVAQAALLYGCKTTEANYREAYEIAHRKQTEDVDSVTNAALMNRETPKLAVVNGDSMAMRTEPVTALTADNKSTRQGLKRFNVVTARFKQVFNARSMRDRLVADGYPEATLLINREGEYYVVAVPTDSSSVAAEALRRVETDSRLSLKAPYPYVLHPSYLPY